MTKIVTEQEWVTLLKKIYMNDSYQRITKTQVRVWKTKVSMPVDELKELHDNLVYNGFTDTEALVITAQVAANGRTN